jgi:WD40 repeat protein
VGVAVYNSKIFSLASDGHIYVHDKTRKLVKWMNIKVNRAFSLHASNDRLFCACADGIVRVFATETLQHLLTLSKPPPLGSTNIKSGISKIKIPQGKESKFADVIACHIDEANNRAVTLYSDRMMFIWDIKKFDQITVYRTFMSHNGAIHDI